MKLINFIVCDDIRNELGNKISLMGIYDASIEFSVTPDQKDRWPKSLRMAVYAKFKIEEEKISEFKFRLNSDKKEVELGGGRLDISDAKKANSVTIAMVFPNFIFKGPGILSFSLDFYNESGIKIGTLSPDVAVEVKEQVMS